VMTWHGLHFRDSENVVQDQMALAGKWVIIVKRTNAYSATDDLRLPPMRPRMGKANRGTAGNLPEMQRASLGHPGGQTSDGAPSEREEEGREEERREVRCCDG
jgi:hypothetical protein